MNASLRSPIRLILAALALAWPSAAGAGSLYDGSFGYGTATRSQNQSQCTPPAVRMRDGLGGFGEGAGELAASSSVNRAPGIYDGSPSRCRPHMGEAFEASASASASLLDGTLRASAFAVGFEMSAEGKAELVDSFIIDLSGAPAGPAPVSISVSMSGVVGGVHTVPPADFTRGFSQLTVAPNSTLHFDLAQLIFSDRIEGGTFGTITAIVDARIHPSFSIAVLLQASALCRDCNPGDFALADFSNTASIELTLPPGAVLISDSGVFPVVPEPGTAVLLGVALAGIVALGRGATLHQ